MFIETENTPNPATIKFIPHQALTGAGQVHEYRVDGGTDIAGSPLAKRLFQVDGVEGVMITKDYIAVTKQAPYDWNVIKVDVLSAIMDHLASGEGAVTCVVAPAPAVEFQDEISQQIQELIETRVRPAVARDGGDITFSHFLEGVVYLRMRGACAGCPSSTATLKSGIENMLKHYIPEVIDVRALDEAEAA